MNIAIMGIRGIPANYGGFETFIEEMAPRLVRRGHQVTVYGRSNIIDYEGERYKGVRIKRLPTISHKYLDTVIHTLVSTVYSFFKRYDLVFICNSANAVFCILPRLMGKPTILNVDGLEWKRQKWNVLGKSFYRLSEFLATFMPTTIVTDAVEVQRYYQSKFGRQSMFIPYGAPTERAKSTDILDHYGLKPGSYFLYVSRMEPENNAHRVVNAFEHVRTSRRLVMVGDAPYSKEYIARIRQTKDDRILFTGYVFGKGYRELQSYAYAYIQATEVGGTHPALLEGMGYGNCVLANDVPEHHEVLGDSGLYFSKTDDSDLADRIQWCCDHPDAVELQSQRIRERVLERYSWEKVSLDYEKLFRTVSRTS